MHETKTLYTDEALLDNIHRWVASMTSSSLRPFRHTAVAVALALMTGLVEAARKLDVRVTKLTQQYEAEQSKAARSRNKQLLATLKQTMDEARSLNEKCRDRITDFFDTVFLHRYRDVDPRIRTDCVEALGSWVIEFPGMFRDPGYLRYLGWMLSDTNSATRNEDLRQLARIFKRDADKLGHFIDRFRGRLVEMATKDAEISVRIAAIGVIDILRVAEMLEPEDLDTVGKLIFDSEPRIRKAVVGFLTDILQAQVEEKIELLGGAEHLNEVFGEPDEDDWHAPRMEWINVKVLAENLASFESQLDGGDAASRQPQVQIAADILGTTAAETRITLAAQALYERLPEVKQWGVIAGYLLYDHSANTQTRSRKKSSSADVSVMRALVPEGREESLLLEVLTSAVKQTLAPGGEADKTKKKAKQDGVESPEETAVTLAKLIPQLLNKFGADAATATVVLRLEHFLDLDIFQRLRQDATTYSKLLDEICAQFLRHVDKSVLTEATAALLHARSYDELQELTDAKLATLWEGVLGPLRHFAESCELSVRGNLDLESLDQLVSLIVKISKLASVSNCLPTLEAEPEGGVPAIKLLISVVRRGMLEKVEAEVDDAEDELVMWAIRACNFYFMWKVVSVLERVRGPEGGIPDVEADALQALRKSYRRNLLYTLTSRAQNDAARLFSTGSLCELHAIFNSLREVIPDAASTNAASISQGQRVQNLRPLLSVMEPRVVSEITSIYTAAERRYARLTRKTLNEPAEDEDPLDLDEDENQDAFVLGPDSDPDDPNRTEEERLAVTLNAERELCELASKLILALDARAIDETGDQANKLRRRLLRNATRLGGAFREVVGFLDENRERRDKEKRQQRAVATTAGAAGKEKGKAPQPEEEEEDEFATPPPVEGSREDLEMRGLLDEEVEDDEEEAGGAPTPPSADDDDILGD